LISGSRYGFDGPDALVLSGPDLFVANYLSRGSVTEIDASTGALVRVISGLEYQFYGPDALAASGGNLLVANNFGSVTEFNASTGALVRVISGAKYQFDQPGALAVWGDDLFVANAANQTNGSLTELDASTGALVRVISFSQYGPGAMAPSGPDLFVVTGDSVTELDASTGGRVRVISGPQYHFDQVGKLAVAGHDLFAVNYGGDSVTELNASTGALVRKVTNPVELLRPSAADNGLWSDLKLTITPTSLGAVHTGMTIEQADNASGQFLRKVGDGVSDPLALPRDFAALWVHGFPVTCIGAALSLASGSEQVIATGQGFTLGDSVAVLRRIYGAGARYVPAPAGGGIAPSAGYVVAGRGGNDLAFIVNPMGTRVDAIVAGRGVDPSSCTG
jgi:hypothetical protein